MKWFVLAMVTLIMAFPLTARGDTKPWQVPVNNGGLVDINIDCYVDIDGKGNFVIDDCTERPQYIPSWSNHGKRKRFYSA